MPYTIEPPSAQQKYTVEPPAEPPSFMSGVGTGVMDKGYGAAQLGVRGDTTSIEAGAMPFAPPVPGRDETIGAVDTAVQQREKTLEKEGYDKGWGRTVGNVLGDIAITAPMGLIPGGAAVTTLGRIGYGALGGAAGGAVSAAAQPVAGNNYVGEKAAQMGVSGATGLVAGGALGALSKAILGNNPVEIEKFIENTYSKSIRPTVAGKGSAPKIEQAEKDVLSALSTIVDNKSSLKLVDKNGREVVGRAPETLDEFVQSIDQAKRPVFEKYDAMTKQAEALGQKIDVTGIAAELRRVAADPALNMPAFKGIRKYAEENATSLEAEGALSPVIAQNRIKNLNEGLSSFYRAASPKKAARAGVNDLIANRMRAEVDRTLEFAGIPGWQAARNEYGALKSIESEVAHRAVVFGRRDPGGGLFGRLGNIASAEELARFAVSLDATALASAVAIKSTKMGIERLNSPNRAVKRMFQKMEELKSSPTPPSQAMQYMWGLAPPAMGGAAGNTATDAMGLQ